jgi:hypothetical protein
MPSGKREWKCMESGQMKRESRNAGSIVDVWLWFVNFVESHLENGAKKGNVSWMRSSAWFLPPLARTKGNCIIPHDKMLQFMLRDTIDRLWI